MGFQFFQVLSFKSSRSCGNLPTPSTLTFYPPPPTLAPESGFRRSISDLGYSGFRFHASVHPCCVSSAVHPCPRVGLQVSDLGFQFFQISGIEHCRACGNLPTPSTLSVYPPPPTLALESGFSRSISDLGYSGFRCHAFSLPFWLR